MEFDSNGMEESPPCSPILGYSGDKDDEVIIDTGIVYCFNCKGPPRPNDNAFSSEGYILRREVTTALENLNPGKCKDQHEPRKAKLFKCFGDHNFDPLEKAQVKIMVALSRKNLTSLEILSEHAPTMNNLISGRMISEDPDDLINLDPWMLRKNVCIFLNYFVRQLKYYRSVWKDDDFNAIFMGLKKSLGSVKDWSGTLKSQCGFRSGNECTSASYHFFHLQLELRWSLLLIFNLKSSILQWVLDDLIQLAVSNYTLSHATVSLDDKQPFNCMCVKELWTMIRLVVEAVKPQQKPFWSFYSDAMQRCNSDKCFPIWLTSHLAQTSRYAIAGVYNPGLVCENNGYDFLRVAFKEWANHGGKSAEILRLSFRIFNYWGGELEIVNSLWSQWTARLDSKGLDVNNLESYSTVDNWLKFVSKLCESTRVDDEDSRTTIPNRMGGMSDEGYLGSNNDPFMEFVRLAAFYASSSSEKDLKRLTSRIHMKLNGLNTADFGELGIIRTTTLFLSLITVVKVDKEAISMCERLHERFQYNKVKDTPGRRKAVIRAYSCSLLILLRRQLKYSDIVNVASNYMRITDELMAHDFCSSLRKELVMVYIHFLECLPKYTPSFSPQVNLGRDAFISANLLMWLSHSDSNYTVRTIRALGQLTEWIVDWVSRFEFQYEYLSSNASAPSEAKSLFIRIKEKCLSFITSSAIAKTNRIPATDLEPLANLAGDITFLTQKFADRGNAYEECISQFDLFALNSQTCSTVSQYYVERLFRYEQFVENNVPLSKWAEVWIRLVFLNCTVPQPLTTLILGPNFASTSNEELLLAFTTNTSLERWTQTELQKVLSSVLPVLKSVMDGNYVNDNKNSYNQEEDKEQVINSAISSCTILLRKFDLLYIKGLMSSVGHQYLEILVPTPVSPTPSWERFMPAVMKSLERNIYSIFVSVVTSSSYSVDAYLTRKLEDIVTFTFYGFAREGKDVDKDEHPLFQILNYCEDNGIADVQHRILPEKIAGDFMTTNVKLREIFLKVVKMLQSNGFPTLVIRVLPGIIRLHPLLAGSATGANNTDRLSLRRCMDAIFYCCIFGSTPVFKENVKKGFKIAFEKDFSSKGRSFINLCLMMAKLNSDNTATVKNSTKAKTFIREELIPLIERHVELAEVRRGYGEDRSLRTPLEKLLQELRPSSV